MKKNLEDIHFSLHSVIVKCSERTKFDLKQLFYTWISGKNASENYRKIDWLYSPVSKTDFPQNIEWTDIIDYAEGLPFKKHSLTKTENEELRIQRMDSAESLFDKFLHEGLTKEQKEWVENTWNNKFNNFSTVDYNHFDFKLEGFSGKYNGKNFVFHEQQKKGVAFLCLKGNGLLAYDVGVGKTATGIAAVMYQLQHEKCNRPLIIVPKTVYLKWVHDIKELFPNVTLNELENLNKKIIDNIRMNSVFSEENENFLLPKNSISICTAEALEKIYFSEESQLCLKERFLHIISEKKQQEYFTPSKLISNENYVFFEELGADLLLVDEAHRYKNLIKKTQGSTYTEFSKLGFGESSSRAIKMFAITEYVHHKNKEKNVFLLSAAPFTNSPMEIYTMLLFTGGNEIRNLGYKNINDFLNEFAEIKIEWTVNNKNEVARKTVMKNFRSLEALQNIIQNYIDKVDAETAHISRPKKETHIVKIEMTNLQKQIYTNEINKLSKTYNLDEIFSAINSMRMCLISPLLVKKSKYENTEKQNITDFVLSSPKLRLVCNTAINVYKEKPDCGQIIYLPRGIKEFKAIKEYLIKNKIPENAIGIINSTTTERNKTKITESFNNPTDKLKILIGSETISEGIDLNGNSLVLYNCLLSWNPTEPIQVEGRIWRQGNLQKKVHIVYPLMYNSLDSLVYQKYDEKSSRIDALWNYCGDKLNVEEINPAELKFDLIKSPEMKADIILEQKTIPLKRKLNIIEESRFIIKSADEKLIAISKEIEEFKAQINELNEEIKKNNEKNKNIPESLLKFSEIINSNIHIELEKLKKNIISKNKKIETIYSTIKRKTGSDFTEKENFLKELDKKQNEIENQITLVQNERNALIQQYKEQYYKNKKTTMQTVSFLVEKLTKDILEKS